MTHRCLLFVALFLPGLTFGGANPEVAPVGIIAAVQNLGPTTAVVVDDRIYFTTPTTQIERGNGTLGSAKDLVGGQRIRFSYGVDAMGGLYLATVKILSGDAGTGGAPLGRQAP
jgi:hypothetical protein